MTTATDEYWNAVVADRDAQLEAAAAHAARLERKLAAAVAVVRELEAEAEAEPPHAVRNRSGLYHRHVAAFRHAARLREALGMDEP